jgi:hypothetical protein
MMAAWRRPSYLASVCWALVPSFVESSGIEPELLKLIRPELLID